jgi:hypothetical protein
VVIGVSLEPEDHPVVDHISISIPRGLFIYQFLIAIFSNNQTIMFDILDYFKDYKSSKASFDEKEKFLQS